MRDDSFVKAQCKDAVIFQKAGENYGEAPPSFGKHFFQSNFSWMTCFPCAYVSHRFNRGSHLSYSNGWSMNVARPL